MSAIDRAKPPSPKPCRCWWVVIKVGRRQVPPSNHRQASLLGKLIQDLPPPTPGQSAAIHKQRRIVWNASSWGILKLVMKARMVFPILRARKVDGAVLEDCNTLLRLSIGE